jgi:hypothetical protein
VGFLSSRKCSKRRIYLMTVNFRMRCRMKGARLEWNVAAFGHVNRVVAAYVATEYVVVRRSQWSRSVDPTVKYFINITSIVELTLLRAAKRGLARCLTSQMPAYRRGLVPIPFNKPSFATKVNRIYT